MSRTPAEEISFALVQGGVRRVYCAASGMCGRMVENLQRCDTLHVVEMPTSEAAVSAALGEAMFTGRIAACCGGRYAMHAGLCEAGRSSAPVLALVPEEEGIVPSVDFCKKPGYCSVSEALRHAVSRSTAEVCVVPSVCANTIAHSPMLPAFAASGGHPAIIEPPMEDIVRLAELLNGSSKIAFLCGRGCKGAREALINLARHLGAPIVYTLRAKDIMEKDNPCAVGMLGLLGWGDAPAVVQVADLLVIWGADFPYSDFLPTHGRVVQVDADAAALGRRTRLCLAVHGDVAETATLLLPMLQRNRSDEFLARALIRHARAVTEMEGSLRMVNERAPLRPEYITRFISSLAEPDAVFVVDAGPSMIWAARYLQMFGQRRLLASFYQGIEGSAVALAIGAKAAAPSRQVVALCSASAFAAHTPELSVMARYGLSVKVFLYNDSEAPSNRWPEGDNRQKEAPVMDYAALAHCMGVESYSLSSVGEVSTVVRRWLSADDPALLDARVDVHALALPPDSALLRTLNHQGYAPFHSLSPGLEAVRRSLYAGSRGYMR